MDATPETDVTHTQLDRVGREFRGALERALTGGAISDSDALKLIALPDHQLPALLAVAGCVRDAHKGRTVTYSPKVFLPVTNLCRDYCSYCTFRKDPSSPEAWTMLPEEVREISSRAKQRGCIEALMCLGDKPERVFPTYRQTLAVLGCETTIEYVEHCCSIALEAGLLPHTNAGLMTREEMARLRRTNVSMGLMLENVSARMCERGGPHHHAPDKEPQLRLQMMREAGELKIPFTTGILLGIGETVEERVASLRAIGDLDAEFGHVQEIIIQNFRAKSTTRMASEPEPESCEMARAIAVARLMLPDMNIQAPPNLSPYDHRLFLAAGINDWGGISPLTVDFVNPEAPWPHLTTLRETCRSAGFTLAARPPVYPEYLDRPGFVEPEVRERARLALEERGDRDAGTSA